MTFNRILVPYDLTEISNKAVDQAVQLSKENHTQIFILHVINEIPLPIRRSKIESRNNEVIISPLVNQVYDELRNDIVPILEDLKEKYRKYKVTITTEIKVGQPVSKIVEFVEQNNIDLVIMGSVGLTGFSGMIKRLGSVARSVAEEVTCPVLIMR